MVRAAEIVRSYDTPVTLRQLFYRLVSEGLLPNTQNAYSTLSRTTTEARRAGTFPDLADEGHEITRWQTFTSPDQARTWVADLYMRDRTEGQSWAIYLGVEKRGLTQQLQSWFGGLGIPILALGGYPSQTFEAQVAQDIDDDGRPSVLLYAGDFDASGYDIYRSFCEHVAFDRTVHLGLNPEQVQRFGLLENPGKDTDTRARAFAAEYGSNVQVELDALPPTELRNLYQVEIDRFFDTSTYAGVVAQERAERAELAPA